MGTLVPTLTLTDSTTFSDDISFSVTDSLNVTAPSQSLTTVAIEASSGSVTAIKPSGADNQYIFVRHTGYQSDGTTATTNQVLVKAASQEAIRLKTGEWAFFPCHSGTVLNAISSSTHTIIIEYAYWTAG